jgi:hypothetical protein
MQAWSDPTGGIRAMGEGMEEPSPELDGDPTALALHPASSAAAGTATHQRRRGRAPELAARRRPLGRPPP